MSLSNIRRRRVGDKDIDWLIAECDRLTARNEELEEGLEIVLRITLPLQKRFDGAKPTKLQDLLNSIWEKLNQ